MFINNVLCDFVWWSRVDLYKTGSAYLHFNTFRSDKYCE